jgi:hypothetical protein
MGCTLRLNFCVLSLISLASVTHAGEISLSIPLECTLGDDCYIQNFVDADPSEGTSDFTCGALSYNGHKGTDFALPTTADMQKGVNVLAADAGIVRAVRDGMQDIKQGRPDAPNVAGKECGNGVVIDHDNGWSSQYCHMRQGSVRVEQGQAVDRNTPLGEVGLSGMTQFPHVHLVVRKDGKVVDPFSPKGGASCTQTSVDTLWEDSMFYQSTGLLSVGITDHLPDYEDVKSGVITVSQLPSDSPAMVVYGFAFGGQKEDIMALTLSGPDGVLSDVEVVVDRPQAQFFKATGKKARAPWPTGIYTAHVEIIRAGTTISDMTHEITVTP